MIILLAVVVFLLFGGVSLYAMNLAYRALNELANGLWRGTLLFCRLTAFLAYSNWVCARCAWVAFERMQIATAQRLYAHWYGFSWRWQRRYIARALRARRAQRRTA
jgi:hypothetical protein